VGRSCIGSKVVTSVRQGGGGTITGVWPGRLVFLDEPTGVVRLIRSEPVCLLGSGLAKMFVVSPVSGVCWIGTPVVCSTGVLRLLSIEVKASSERSFKFGLMGGIDPMGIVSVCGSEARVEASSWGFGVLELELKLCIVWHVANSGLRVYSSSIQSLQLPYCSLFSALQHGQL
jgi:hypothetical protein